MIVLNGIDKILEYIPATQLEIKNAGRNAVNATATYIAKLAINKISSETGLNKNIVKSNVSTKRTTQQLTESQVLASTKRPKLTDYDFSVSFKGTKGTVSADISMLRNKQIIQNNTFVNPKNRQKIMKRKGITKYPVFIPTGPSVSHHFDRISDDLVREGNDYLLKSFAEKIDKQISKR